MADALIGYSGFVGSTLLRQRSFDALYNSKNIEEIRGREFGLLVCAGAPAAKWMANKEPQRDLENLQRLADALRCCSARQVLLISTVDVYANPVQVDESSSVLSEQAGAYGRHRFWLEERLRTYAGSLSVVRLPALFGKGLKKNFVYDLLHDNCLEWTDADSVFQFYDMDRLWRDCALVLERGAELVNFATAPVRAGDVAERCFGRAFTNKTAAGPVRYDMRTRCAGLFGREGHYLASELEVFEGLRRFAAEEKARA